MAQATEAGGAAAGDGAFAADRRVTALPDGLDGWIEERLVAARPVALLLVALSRLDLVNAAHGRAAGSLLLDEAQARLVTAAGADAFVARGRGAEIVCAVEAAGGAVAALTERIDRALAQPFRVERGQAVVGHRLGVAEAGPRDYAALLFRRAAQALARTAAEPGATDPADVDALAVDLHHALDRGEIAIVYQPQVTVATGRITGVEALARWRHPARGLLGAAPLFAAADRAGLGLALSAHVQDLALAAAAGWQGRMASLRVSLNVTADDLARPGFAPAFLARVKASGALPQRLTVEVTEAGAIGDAQSAAGVLAQLRAAGLRVAIDDFGTGYASLAWLKALPVDYLKIDQALTADIVGSERDRVVVRGVLAIARGLGLSVIAEGVETEAQRDLLATEGCALYQGFLTAEPLDEAALATLLEE